MSTYDPAAQPVISPHQFTAMPHIASGQQFGGVRAALNSSTGPANPAGAVGTLATFSQAARASAM